MAQGKEIRTKIASVRNTQKITSAMEMVAASKMRRAQERMAAARPYAERMRTIISHLASANPEYVHPLMTKRAEQRCVAYLIVSSDRGLCGGLNANLFRSVVMPIREHNEEAAHKPSVITVGSKGTAFFKRIGNTMASVTRIGDVPELQDLIGVVKTAMDIFTEQKVDAVYLASNTFANTMVQSPTIAQLLPLAPSDDDSFSTRSSWDYLYEPSARDVLDVLLPRYIESVVYQSVVENIACEQAARMIAMKSASDNAGELIGQLQLAYNKARQAMITQELSEIVAGAAAV